MAESLERAERAQQLRGEIDAIRVTAASPRNEVEVVVDATGCLVDVVFRDAAIQLSGADLSRAVLAAASPTAAARAHPPVSAHGYSGSVSPEVLNSIFRHEYPELREVNAPRWATGADGFDNNCTRCVVATDYTLSGAPSSAMPSGAASPNDVTNALGGRWEAASSYDSIVARMESLGEGSRGVVLLDRGPGNVGHVFNVVFDRNGVVFLDGQTGSFATLEVPYHQLHFLETARGTP